MNFLRFSRRKIFLSYARDDFEVAASIAHSLRSRGFQVFFDQSDIRAGKKYEQLIEKEIQASDLFLFLISPQALEERRYTLTELRIAEKKWLVADGNVLPVLVSPTDMDTIPAYLKSVSIFESKGSIAANVASQVSDLLKSQSKNLKSLSFVVSVLLFSVAIVLFLNQPKAPISIKLGGLTSKELSLFGRAPKYSARLTIENVGSDQQDITSFEIVSNDGLQVSSEEGFDVYIPLAANKKIKHELPFSVENVNTDATYGVCITTLNAVSFEENRVCSERVLWNVGEPVKGAQIKLFSETESSNTTYVHWDGRHYLVAQQNPNRLVSYSEDGVALESVNLKGVPQLVSSGPHGTYVGTTAPNQILRLDTTSRNILTAQDITFPTGTTSDFDSPVSTEPMGMTQASDAIWVTTGGGSSNSGIGYFDPSLGALRVPPYLHDVSFSLPNYNLRFGYRGLWTGESHSVPASILKLSSEDYSEFGGHDYQISACASSVYPTKEYLVAVGCGGKVLKLELHNEQLQNAGTFGVLSNLKEGQNEWSDVSIVKHDAESTIVAATIGSIRGMGSSSDDRSMILSLDSNGNQKTILKVYQSQISSVAVGEKSVMFLLESKKEGKKQLGIIKFD